MAAELGVNTMHSAFTAAARSARASSNGHGNPRFTIPGLAPFSHRKITQQGLVVMGVPDALVASQVGTDLIHVEFTHPVDETLQIRLGHGTSLHVDADLVTKDGDGRESSNAEGVR